MRDRIYLIRDARLSRRVRLSTTPILIQGKRRVRDLNSPGGTVR